MRKPATRSRRPLTERASRRAYGCRRRRCCCSCCCLHSLNPHDLQWEDRFCLKLADAPPRMLMVAPLHLPAESSLVVSSRRQIGQQRVNRNLSPWRNFKSDGVSQARKTALQHSVRHQQPVMQPTHFSRHLCENRLRFACRRASLDDTHAI